MVLYIEGNRRNFVNQFNVHMATRIFTFLFFYLVSFVCVSQVSDSVKPIQLKEIELYVKPSKNEVQRMSEIHNGIIYSGKKNERCV